MQFDASKITAIIDTREQTPANLDPLHTVRKALATGDYSIVGFEDEIAIERKALQDFVMCCGSERDRFEREIQRLMAYSTRAIVVEASWQDLLDAKWRGKMTSNQVVGSALAWIAKGIPIIFAGSDASNVIRRMLILSAKHRYLKFAKLIGM